MKKSKSVFAASTLAMLLCASASAFAFSTTPIRMGGPGPVWMPGTAQGALSLTKNGRTLTCNTVFAGTWNLMKGDFQLTKVDFGTTPLECAKISTHVSAEAPLKGRMTKDSMTIDNVEVGFAGDAVKCTGPLVASLKDSTVSFNEYNLVGGCKVTGSMTLQQITPLLAN